MPTEHQLALPAAPVTAARLRGPSDALATAAAARTRPFLLTGRGCTVRGVESRGVEAVEDRGRLVLAGLTVPGATCGNVILAPAQARRELVGPAGVVMEVLLAGDTGVAASWSRRAGAPAAPLQVTFTVPGTAWRAEGPFLRADGPAGTRLVQVQPAPRWSVTEGAGTLAVTATAEVGSGELGLLAVAGADGAAAEQALRGLTRTREARVEAEVTALRGRRLATDTGVAELDDALVWAAARLDAAPGDVHELAAAEPFPGDPASRRAWTLMGLLASGGSPGKPDLPDPGQPLPLLAAAWMGAWRGSRLTDRPLPHPRPGQAWVRTGSPLSAGWQAAFLAVADAVEAWGRHERAATLRQEAAPLAPSRDAEAGPLRGLRLPTLGGRRADLVDPVAHALATAFELPGWPPYRPPYEDPPPGLLRALAAWACFNGGHLDRGFALLRRHFADGFSGGAGLWPDGPRIHDPAAAALVPLAFLHGLLGARGDAHFGRLRLSPRLPPNWNRLVVRGIRMGDATVRMDFVRRGGRDVFRLCQESGRVPVMVIFEPLVAAPPDAPVRVDGEPAEVEVRHADGRVQVRLQLPLDREREVAVGGPG